MKLSSALLGVAEEASPQVAEILARAGLPYSSRFTPGCLQVSGKAVRKMAASEAERIVAFLNADSLRDVWTNDKRKGVRHCVLESKRLPDDMAVEGLMWLEDNAKSWDDALFRKLYGQCTTDELIDLTGKVVYGNRGRMLADSLVGHCSDEAETVRILSTVISTEVRAILFGRGLIGELPVTPDSVVSMLGTDEHMLDKVVAAMPGPLGLDSARLLLKHAGLREARLRVYHPAAFEPEATELIAEHMCSDDWPAAFAILEQMGELSKAVKHLTADAASRLGINAVIALIRCSNSEDLLEVRTALAARLVDIFDPHDTNQTSMVAEYHKYLDDTQMLDALTRAEGEAAKRMASRLVDVVSRDIEQASPALIDALLASDVPAHAKVSLVTSDTSQVLLNRLVTELVEQSRRSASYQDSAVARTLLERVPLSEDGRWQVVNLSGSEAPWVTGRFEKNLPTVEAVTEMVLASTRIVRVLREIAHSDSDLEIRDAVLEAAVTRCEQLESHHSDAPALAEELINGFTLTDEQIARLVTSVPTVAIKALTGTRPNQSSRARRATVATLVDPDELPSAAWVNSFLADPPAADEMHLLTASRINDASRDSQEALLNGTAVDTEVLTEVLARGLLTSAWMDGRLAANPFSEEVLTEVLARIEPGSSFGAGAASALMRYEQGRKFLYNDDAFVATVRAAARSGTIDERTRAIWMLLHEAVGDDPAVWNQVSNLLDDWPGSLASLVLTARATVQ